MDLLAHPWSLSRAEWLRANSVAYGLAIGAFAIPAIGIGVLILVQFSDGLRAFSNGSWVGALMSVLVSLMVVVVMVLSVAIGALFNSIAFALPLTALASLLAARSAGRARAGGLFAGAGAIVGLLGTVWPFTLLTLFSVSINDRLEYPWGWVLALPVFVVVVAALYLAAWVITVRPRTRIARLQARTATGSVAK